MGKMQCKDIEDFPIVRYINEKQQELGQRVLIWDIEPRWFGLPEKLFRAKMQKLINKGLIDGCTCGCRGDYEMTDAGKEYLRKQLEQEFMAQGVPRVLVEGAL